MLASTPNILQMCSFDASKSTKGASKLRRDLINSEIANLRDLLPLPSSTRQRLSQLQLMALVCVYVRKANYFQHAFRKHDLTPEVPIPHFGFSKALSGFLMMMTQNGKLLYISDNAAEYLGHSMEDLLIHGDSVYDIIEKQDHQTIQTELMRTPNPLTLAPDTRIFLCRMNVSRNARRQMRFGDQKVVLIQGHYVSFLPLCSRNEPVFLATCTPVAMPETRECVVQGSTNVFTSIHSMDMKFLHIDRNGEFHMGYNKTNVQGLSWYDFVHWEHLREAQSKHRLITQSEQERSCILLLRLQTMTSNWIWVHVVLQVKDSSDSSQQPVIVCTNQVLSDREAAVMRANSWLYQFYSLHSKMHYGLAYEAHTTRLPSYYPNAAPAVMSHAYHHAASAGGAEAAAVPLHSVPYHHIHSAITPLNGTTGHRHPHHPHHPHHPQAVLQYSPQAGSLPYPSIVAAVNATTATVTESNNKHLPNTPTKRSQSPQSAQQQEPEESESPEPPNKRPNLSHHNLPPPPTSTYHHPRASTFTYPTSMFGAGGFTATSMTTVTELGTVVPGYYGGPQMLTSVPYHAQIGHHFRNQNKFSLFNETDSNEIDQSLIATNAEDVSNLMAFSSPAYFKYASPGVMQYQHYGMSPSDRDLEKAKSPESIVSTTSDYASMTSLSPPSAFEKPDKKESIYESGDNPYNEVIGITSSLQTYQTLKGPWNATPIYTDLTASLPAQLINQLDKDNNSEIFDNRFATLRFPNASWDITRANEKESLSLGTSNRGNSQHELYSHSQNGMPNAAIRSSLLPLNGRESHTLVTAPQNGHILSNETHIHPQTVHVTDIPSSSPSSGSGTASSSVVLRPSSCGVGRASGYGGVRRSSIAKEDRNATTTAQDTGPGP